MQADTEVMQQKKAGLKHKLAPIYTIQRDKMVLRMIFSLLTCLVAMTSCFYVSSTAVTKTVLTIMSVAFAVTIIWMAICDNELFTSTEAATTDT